MQRRQSQRPLRGAGAGRSLQRWQARICRQGGAAPRAVHGRVTVTVTRHISGAGAERPPPRVRRVSWRQVGDELACWRAAGDEPHPRHGRRAKVLSVDQLGELQVCRMEVRLVGVRLRARASTFTRGWKQRTSVGAGPRAPRHALKSQGPPPESRDQPGTPRGGPRERPGCAGRWHSE